MSALKYLLFARSFLSTEDWSELFSVLMRRKLLGKEECLYLYHAQSREVRQGNNAYLTLRFLSGLMAGGHYEEDQIFPSYDGGEHLFSRQEIIALAEEVGTVHVDDVAYFIGAGGLYYRSEKIPLSMSLLLLWMRTFYEDEHTRRDLQKGESTSKLLSLLLICVYEKLKEDGTVNHPLFYHYLFEVAVEGFLEVVRVCPDSHAVSRYLGLLSTLATHFSGEERRLLRGSLVQTFVTAVDILLETYAGRYGFSTARTFVQIYLTDDFFTEEEKEVIKIAIAKKGQEVASRYFFFLDDALGFKL